MKSVVTITQRLGFKLRTEWGSHKPGFRTVRNVDVNGNIIRNPKNISHNYGSVNYNNGGMILWIKTK
ncbi:MAG: hypothetical protein F9K09_02215 [Flavobacteriales bacterium]|nr:MAG: hypothetical protein F9K09_02215 [Flavobacteriales bacterium]